MISLAPKAQLTASVDFWNPYYIQRAKDVIAGTWKSQDVWGGFKSGMLVMAPYANMPEDVAKAGKAAEAGISRRQDRGLPGPDQGPERRRQGAGRHGPR